MSQRENRMHRKKRKKTEIENSIKILLESSSMLAHTQGPLEILGTVHRVSDLNHLISQRT